VTATTDVIVGGDGTLGRALRQRLGEINRPLVWTTRRGHAADDAAVELDLGNPHALKSFDLPEPLGRVYLLAAVTSLHACRTDPAGTRRINVDAVARLGERIAESGGTPVLVSTNLVFDGRVARVAIEAPVRPQTEYGRQKVDAEAAVLSLGGVVLRPTKIVPPGWDRLRDWALRLQRRQTVNAFTDLWFAPVPLSRVLDTLANAMPGIHHESGQPDISYFEAALHLAQRLDADPDLVVPAQAADHGIPPEQRPRHTTLACAQPAKVWQTLDEAMRA
jgi:dTDP-4-dehydrorhamnose reductase